MIKSGAVSLSVSMCHRASIMSHYTLKMFLSLVSILSRPPSSLLPHSVTGSLTPPHAAFKYTLTVDGDQASPRVVLLSEGAGGKFVVLTENEVADNVTMSGAGVGNRLCTGTYTFAIRVSRGLARVLISYRAWYILY